MSTFPPPTFEIVGALTSAVALETDVTDIETIGVATDAVEFVSVAYTGGRSSASIGLPPSSACVSFTGQKVCLIYDVEILNFIIH